MVTGEDFGTSFLLLLPLGAGVGILGVNFDAILALRVFVLLLVCKTSHVNRRDKVPDGITHAIEVV